MKFLLDTNFLLIPGKFKVDIFSELGKFGKPEFYTLDLVIRELENISKGKGSDSRAALLGLGLIREKGVKVVEAAGYLADKEMEDMSEEYTICTQDKKLRTRLKNKGRRPIFLRQKRFLVKD